MIATAGAGAAVALERALGWSRQLRLTPLNPAAYVVAKVIVAMVTGAVAIAVVFAAGLARARTSTRSGSWSPRRC